MARTVVAAWSQESSLKYLWQIVLVRMELLGRFGSLLAIIEMEKGGQNRVASGNLRLGWTEQDEHTVACRQRVAQRKKRRTQMLLIGGKARSSEEMEPQWHANVKSRGEKGRNEMLHK